MKISNLPPAPRTDLPPGIRSANGADRSGGASRASATGSTEVKLSAAIELQAASSDGDFDAGRVEQLRAAIDAGTFRVNAEKVADSLIASNLDALKSPGRS